MANQQFVAMSLLSIAWFIVGLLSPTPVQRDDRLALVVVVAVCSFLAVLLFTGSH